MTKVDSIASLKAIFLAAVLSLSGCGGAVEVISGAGQLLDSDFELDVVSCTNADGTFEVFEGSECPPGWTEYKVDSDGTGVPKSAG